MGSKLSRYVDASVFADLFERTLGLIPRRRIANVLVAFGVAEADPLQFMLLDASERALDDAGYDRASIDRELCGVVVGTEFGGDFSDQLEMGLRLPEMKHLLAQSLQRRGYSAEQIVDSLFASAGQEMDSEELTFVHDGRRIGSWSCPAASLAELDGQST